MEENTDWIPPDRQPVEVLTLDTAPPITRPAPDTNMSGLASLKSGIHTIEALPGTMKTPAKNLAQDSEQTGHIRRLNDLTIKADTNLLETEDEHGNETELPEAHQDTYREWPSTPVAQNLNLNLTPRISRLLYTTS